MNRPEIARCVASAPLYGSGYIILPNFNVILHCVVSCLANLTIVSGVALSESVIMLFISVILVILHDYDTSIKDSDTATPHIIY